jgi:hypothetical protein
LSTDWPERAFGFSLKVVDFCQLGLIRFLPMEEEAVQSKRQKHRSPSYPAIGLEAALRRAQDLEKIAGRHSAPISAALEAWGFSAKSSNGSLTLAALKKFSLADDSGKLQTRTVSLTRLGQELVFYSSERESEEWKHRARQAALKPAIYEHLWAKYRGDLPSDSVVLPYLVFELNFSESAATEVLRQFRQTIVFAGLGQPDASATVSGNEAEDRMQEEGSELVAPAELELSPVVGRSSASLELQTGHIGPPTPALDVQMPMKRTIQLPYSRSGWALLQAEFPMSSAAWDQMLAVLQAMKPSLVDSDET